RARVRARAQVAPRLCRQDRYSRPLRHRERGARLDRRSCLRGRPDRRRRRACATEQPRGAQAARPLRPALGRSRRHRNPDRRLGGTMRLVMFMKDKQPRAGVIDGDDIVDINAADRSLPTTLKGILEVNALSRLKKLVKSKKRIPLRKARLLPPISNPGLLLSVGMNYHEHLKEMKTPVPEKPAAFTKSAASVIASGEPIVLPASHPNMVDWEGEFTVVIGKGGHRIPAARALDHVAGYTLVNDVSARDWVAAIFQSQGIMGPIHAWEHNLLGKMMPTFCPM